MAHRFRRQRDRAFRSRYEESNAFPSDKAGANVRQLDGKAGEVWGGESGTTARLVVIQTVALARRRLAGRLPLVPLLTSAASATARICAAPVHALPRLPQP